MFRFLFTLLMIDLSICFSATPVRAQIFEKVPELQGDIVIFPITLINAYPFIPGKVNGVAGKFMFDTGFGATIMLNDNFIKLPYKKMKGDGVVGSGQSFTTNINNTISEIGFTNGMSYRNLEKIGSGNFDFLQKEITPDFLGFIGHQFFKDYLFKIDYLHKKVTFYRNLPERNLSKDFLNNEKFWPLSISRSENYPIAR